MRIVHVHHTFYPVIGGMERVVQKLAEEQAKLGHEVHVVMSMYGAEGRPREELMNGVYVHRVKACKLGYPDVMIPMEYPDSILRDADVVHIHSQNSFFNMKMAKRAKRYGVQVVIHFVAVDALATHPNPIKRMLGLHYQKLLTRKALKIADLILVKSMRDKQVLRDRYGVDAVYVPDGIDDKYLSKPKDPDTFRRKFSIEEDTRIYLYIGRLHPAKGPQVLVKAVPLLCRSSENFRVVLIGPGLREWLIKMAKKLGVERYVLLTGPVEEDLKISAIDASICVVVSSLYDYVEVFSLVVSEAWAREKPVVASAVGELPYRIRHGVNGLLVPPNNPQTLAKTLIELDKYDLKPSISKLKTWHEIARELCLLYGGPQKR